MNPTLVLFVYALAVVLGSALLAPWVYCLLHPMLPSIPFRRVADRTFMIVALLGLWPLLRSVGIRTWNELGFPLVPDWKRQIGTGFLLGVITFLLICGGLLATGSREWTSPRYAIWVVLCKALMTGILVGVLEEIIFRGSLLGILRKGLPLWWAVILTSLLYSIMHLLRSKNVTGDVHWLSGFEQLGVVFSQVPQQSGGGVGFVTLSLAGVILAVAFIRTGALYLPIGLHAGWVVTIKVFSGLSRSTGFEAWWGNGSIVFNALAWPILLGLLFWLCRRHQHS